MTDRLLAAADRIAHFLYEPTRLGRDLSVARWHHRIHLLPHRLIEPLCERYDRSITGGRRTMGDLVTDTATPATPVCGNCRDSGYACEDHPGFPWEGVHGSTALHPEHGGIGMPCPACCDPIPVDGTASITDAFMPRHLRG